MSPSPSEPALAIRIENLKFGWRANAPPVLQIPRFQLSCGERLFLFGPSGSGKSTFLNLISGLLVPTDGAVEIAGTDISRLGQRARDRFRARHMGIIFQQFNLIPYLSVLDNLRLARHFAGQPQQETATVARTLLGQLGLSADLLDRRPDELSVGQQQRVAVARALAHEPALILADEPSSALDSDARDAFITLLGDVATRHGSSVIVVSHDRALASHFDRALDLRELSKDTPSP